ncbi:MAG: hypothetical protein ABIJ23_00650 [Candidatus Magasanikbacteria bacterium]
MKDFDFEALTSEFSSSLGIYTQDADMDNRVELATQVVSLGAQTAVEFYSEAVHDLTAMLTGVVKFLKTAGDHIKILGKDEKIQAFLDKLKAIDPDMFGEILGLIGWAYLQPELRPFIAVELEKVSKVQKKVEEPKTSQTRAVQPVMGLKEFDGLFGKEPQLVRASIAQDPVRALTILVQGRESTSLNLTGQARVFEDILGEIPDLDKALQMVQDHLTPDYLAELLAERGDLPSTAAEIATAEMLATAFRVRINDLTQGGHFAYLYLFEVRAWALKLKDHREFEEWLDQSIGTATIREQVVQACWLETEGDISVMVGELNFLGIDMSEEDILTIVETQQFELPDLGELAEEKAEFMRLKKAREEKDQAYQAQQEAEEGADDLDM